MRGFFTHFAIPLFGARAKEIHLLIRSLRSETITNKMTARLSPPPLAMVSQQRKMATTPPAIDTTLMHSIFHLAFNVRDLDQSRRFYGDVLGCREGRSTETWVDFDFFGHQISLHLGEPFATRATGQVGEHAVPMPHFGVILALAEWQALAERLRGGAVDFVVAPTVRFAGEPGEQSTMFFTDPAGNAIEFKAFADDAMIFSTQPSA